MRYSVHQIVFQEVPTEVSLAFHVVGCPLRCPGCHSSDLWNPGAGKELDEIHFFQMIEKYKSYITCVLFLGGEWELQTLLRLCQLAQENGLKTALYTGYELEEIPLDLYSQLDYIKYGPYKFHLGGLSSKNTNQRLINTQTKEVLNHYFTEEDSHDAND